jgi:uncharacterized repeat protein (TIGR01451 family)
MKLSRMFNSLPKKAAAAALIALAVALPAASFAATTVKFSADTTVSNATQNAGSMNWGSSATAKYNEVVAIQVVYDNNEAPDSGKTANNVRVKINIPSKAGKSQTITTTAGADNAKTVNGSAKVTLDRDDAYLQYIPGTATWKHAKTANGPMTVTQKVSDDVVLGANGINLGTENPCQAGSIVVQARVMVPGLTVDKFVRHKGDTSWATSINAKAGDVLQYEIAYHNTGNVTQNDVEFRDQLPKGIAYVPGSTKLKSGNYPNGLDVKSDALVASNGITTGDYAPGAAGYVMFEAKVTGSDLKCGENTLRNIAFVQPKGMNYYYNTADVVVNKECQAAYSCDAFMLSPLADRTVKVSKFNYTAKDGATFNNVVINWGDNTAALTTNTPVGQKHQFAKDGEYTVTATAHFTVNGKDVTSVGSCTQKVSFSSPTATPPAELPNTGAGDTIGLFAAVTVAAAIAHRVFMARRWSRQ